MKYIYYTPEELLENINKFDNTKKWVLHLEYSGTPSEVFQAISFLSTEESGKLSEHGLGVIIFNTEKHASRAIEMLKESKDLAIKASLIHGGLLIDSI